MILMGEEWKMVGLKKKKDKDGHNLSSVPSILFCKTVNNSFIN